MHAEACLDVAVALLAVQAKEAAVIDLPIQVRHHTGVGQVVATCPGAAAAGSAL